MREQDLETVPRRRGRTWRFTDKSGARTLKGTLYAHAALRVNRPRKKLRVIALEDLGCVSRLEDFYAAVSMGSGERCGGRISVDLCGFEGSTDRQRPASRSACNPGHCLVHHAVRGRGLLGHGPVRTGQGAVPAP